MLKSVTFKNVLTFTLPSISMMLFMSVYTMVDGIFVANLIGEQALAAINIVLPIITIFIAVGTMLGTGGNALCARLLGEGKAQEAKERFTLFAVTGFVISLVIMLVVQAFIQDILLALGATEDTYQYCYDYIFILTFFAPCAILQTILENSMIASGKPHIALVAMVLGGFTNIILDYVFIVHAGLGMSGVALATGLGYMLPTCIGLYFFSTRKGQRPLHFTKLRFSLASILKACSNGSSEMVTHLATGVTTYLFNITMLTWAGNDGITAITVVLYAQLLINTFFIGFSMGIAPVISFYFGAMDRSRLRKLFSICMQFVGITSLLLVGISLSINTSIAGVFLDENSQAYALTVHGFYIFSAGFLFSGINVFASGLFTAYSNGKISAYISFLRTFVFITLAILTLPEYIGINGIWLAVPLAEFLAFLLSLYLFFKYQEQYMYTLKPRRPLKKSCLLQNETC